jgi:hypothetical protein
MVGYMRTALQSEIRSATINGKGVRVLPSVLADNGTANVCWCLSDLLVAAGVCTSDRIKKGGVCNQFDQLWKKDLTDVCPAIVDIKFPKLPRPTLHVFQDGAEAVVLAALGVAKGLPVMRQLVVPPCPEDDSDGDEDEGEEGGGSAEESVQGLPTATAAKEVILAQMGVVPAGKRTAIIKSFVRVLSSDERYVALNTLSGIAAAKRVSASELEGKAANRQLTKKARDNAAQRLRERAKGVWYSIIMQSDSKSARQVLDAAAEELEKTREAGRAAEKRAIEALASGPTGAVDLDEEQRNEVRKAKRTAERAKRSELSLAAKLKDVDELFARVEAAPEDQLDQARLLDPDDPDILAVLRVIFRSRVELLLKIAQDVAPRQTQRATLAAVRESMRDSLLTATLKLRAVTRASDVTMDVKLRSIFAPVAGLLFMPSDRFLASREERSKVMVAERAKWNIQATPETAPAYSGIQWGARQLISRETAGVSLNIAQLVQTTLDEPAVAACCDWLNGLLLLKIFIDAREDYWRHMRTLGTVTIMNNRCTLLSAPSAKTWVLADGNDHKPVTPHLWQLRTLMEGLKDGTITFTLCGRCFDRVRVVFVPDGVSLYELSFHTSFLSSHPFPHNQAEKPWLKVLARWLPTTMTAEFQDGVFTARLQAYRRRGGGSTDDVMNNPTQATIDGWARDELGGIVGLNPLGIDHQWIWKDPLHMYKLTTMKVSANPVAANYTASTESDVMSALLVVRYSQPHAHRPLLAPPHVSKADGVRPCVFMCSFRLASSTFATSLPVSTS